MPHYVKFTPLYEYKSGRLYVSVDHFTTRQSDKTIALYDRSHTVAVLYPTAPCRRLFRENIIHRGSVARFVFRAGDHLNHGKFIIGRR